MGVTRSEAKELGYYVKTHRELLIISKKELTVNQIVNRLFIDNIDPKAAARLYSHYNFEIKKLVKHENNI